MSVVEWLEHKLHPYSAFLVVPIFALANAGIRVPADQLGDAFTSPVTWGVILGLVVGKTVGISAFTLLAVALARGIAPDRGDTSLRRGRRCPRRDRIHGVVVRDRTRVRRGRGRHIGARLGVLVASLAAAVIGTLILIPGRVDDDHSMDENEPEHATVG